MVSSEKNFPFKTFVGLTATRAALRTDVGRDVFNQSAASYSYTLPDNTDLDTIKVGEFVKLTNTNFNGEINVVFPAGVGYNSGSTAGNIGFYLKNVGASAILIRESDTNYVASIQLPYDSTTSVLGAGDHTEFCANVQSIGPSDLHFRQNGVSANRAIAQTDLGVILRANNAPRILTLPAAGDISLNSMAEFWITQTDAFTLSIQAPAGVKINGLDGALVSTQNEGFFGMMMRKTNAINEWFFITYDNEKSNTFNNPHILSENFSARTSETTVNVNGVAKNTSFLASTTAALTTDPASSLGLETFNNSAIDPTTIYFLKSRGSKDAPLPALFGDGVANLVFGATNSNGEMKTDGAFFRVESGTGTATAMPMNMFFGVQNLDSGASTAAIMIPGFIDFGAINGAGTFNITGSSKINLQTPDLQLNGGSLTGRFSQTAAKVVSNTTVETSILGAGVGSAAVAANTFKVGGALKFDIKGALRTNGAGQTLILKVYAGPTSNILIATASTSVLSDIIAIKYFNIDLSLVIRQIGGAATASVYTAGELRYPGSSSNEISISEVESTLFNTTAANVFDVKVQWGDANANNSIVSEIATLTREY